MARKNSGKPGLLSQLRLAWTQSKALDPRLAPMVAGAAVLGFAIPFVILLLMDLLVVGAVAGVLVGVLAGMSVFGRRASAVQLTAIEGQPGAAAAVVQSLRGIWRLTPAVAVTRSQDLVHRVVGRPGIVLVGEGAPSRVAQLLAQEKRRVGRVAKDVPIHEVSVGTGKGQVSLSQLRVHMMKLPRALKPRQIGALERKLSALGEQNIPIPKGPMPSGRPPKRMR